MKSNQRVTYYFSVISDWAYMGGAQFAQLVNRHNLDVAYRPFILERLYSSTGGILLSKRSSQRQAYRVAELRRWSKRLGIPVNHFPKYSTTDDKPASRLIALFQERGLDTGTLVRRIHRSVWLEERDIAQDSTLLQIMEGMGTPDGRVLLEDSKSEYHSNILDGFTKEAADNGVFGSPFYIYDGEIYWGQDRLDMLEEQIVNSYEKAAG